MRSGASAAAPSPSALASRPRPCASGSPEMLDARSTEDEWMDDAAAGEPEFAAALEELGRINRLTLAFQPVLSWLDRLVERTGATELSILDVGCGGGQMLTAIEAWAGKRGVAVAPARRGPSPLG